MSNIVIWLSVAVFSSAALTIRADYAGPHWQVYLFKPLTTFVILLIAIYGEGSWTPYQGFIAIGLVFSLAGDIFLMLPSERFIAGLSSFLLAHLFYIAAFSSGVGFDYNPWLLTLLLGYGGIIYALLARALNKMTLSVLLYMAVILIMAYQAGNRWLLFDQAALWGFLGTILFLVSDSVLALNRFRQPFRAAQAVVLSSYFLAQGLIALTVFLR